MAEFVSPSVEKVGTPDLTTGASELKPQPHPVETYKSLLDSFSTWVNNMEASKAQSEKADDQEVNPMDLRGSLDSNGLSHHYEPTLSKYSTNGKDAYKPIGTMPTSFEGLKTYITQAAKARGLDPSVVMTVAEHEGLQPGTWRSNYKNAAGIREPSYGPFQLLVGGPGTGFGKGLGNQFQQQTGLDPRDQSTVFRQVDFALDYAKANGWSSWYGAARAGVSRWQGIRNI